MMNCRKHIKLNNIFFLLIIITITACSKEEKKKDFVARVNDTYLTREELASLVDTTKIDPADREQVIKDWIYREVLYKKANDEKITKQEDYKNIIGTSSKELAAAMLLKNYLNSEEINFSDAELKGYYEKNKSYFRLNFKSYLINEVIFKQEDKAINFRSLAIESDWTKAANFFNNDSALISNINSELVQENELYPRQLMKIAKDLYSQEISVVINDGSGKYSIIQMLGKFDAGTIPEFEIVKSEVQKRFLNEKKKHLVDQYLKELYSKNDIEIKK